MEILWISAPCPLRPLKHMLHVEKNILIATDHDGVTNNMFDPLMEAIGR